MEDHEFTSITVKLLWHRSSVASRFMIFGFIKNINFVALAVKVPNEGRCLHQTAPVLCELPGICYYRNFIVVFAIKKGVLFFMLLT